MKLRIFAKYSVFEFIQYNFIRKIDDETNDDDENADDDCGNGMEFINKNLYSSRLWLNIVRKYLMHGTVLDNNEQYLDHQWRYSQRL